MELTAASCLGAPAGPIPGTDVLASEAALAVPSVLALLPLVASSPPPSAAFLASASVFRRLLLPEARLTEPFGRPRFFVVAGACCIAPAGFEEGAEYGGQYVGLWKP